MEIELYFGFGNLIDYEIGSTVQWILGKAPQNGGRPEGGNVDGEGYVECPFCGKDFFVVAEVRNDVIAGVRNDPSKKGYLQDQ